MFAKNVQDCRLVYIITGTQPQSIVKDVFHYPYMLLNLIYLPLYLFKIKKKFLRTCFLLALYTRNDWAYLNLGFFLNTSFNCCILISSRTLFLKFLFDSFFFLTLQVKGYELKTLNSPASNFKRFST